MDISLLRSNKYKYRRKQNQGQEPVLLSCSCKKLREGHQARAAWRCFCYLPSQPKSKPRNPSKISLTPLSIRHRLALRGFSEGGDLHDARQLAVWHRDARVSGRQRGPQRTAAGMDAESGGGSGGWRAARRKSSRRFLGSSSLWTMSSMNIYCYQ